ncbi:hypothetical protein IMSAG049_00161 [Clostridiales bacterium]|nr:hypothetical protein IMSAG049_00161 [Clostridiales bacterium]
MEFSVLTEQMKIIATLMVIGFIWKKSKIFDNQLVDSLSAIMAKLVLPLMICTMIGSVSRSELAVGGRVFISALIIYIIISFGGKAISRFYRVSGDKKGMHVLLQFYGNSGFIGIPLITSVFGEKAGIVTAAYLIVDTFFYWVVGPYIVGNKLSLKKFLSPITVSIFLGIIITLLPVSFNGNIIWDTAKNVGGTCKYFASIYIGMVIGRMDLKKVRENIYSLTAAPVKLILLPLLAYLVFGRTGFLSGDMLLMFVILSATPCGMALPIVARVADADTECAEYASVGVTISTVLCLVTLPLMVYLTMMMEKMV